MFGVCCYAVHLQSSIDLVLCREDTKQTNSGNSNKKYDNNYFANNNNNNTNNNENDSDKDNNNIHGDSDNHRQ